jgi:hypothetical protein
MWLLRFLGHRMVRWLARPRVRHAHPCTSAPSLLARPLRRGDVLLVEGDRRFSSAIQYLTQYTWSHAGLYIGDLSLQPGGHVQQLIADVDVIEGVRIVPLSRFAHQHTRICRPQGVGRGRHRPPG